MEIINTFNKFMKNQPCRRFKITFMSYFDLKFLFLKWSSTLWITSQFFAPIVIHMWKVHLCLIYIAAIIERLSLLNCSIHSYLPFSSEKRHFELPSFLLMHFSVRVHCCTNIPMCFICLVFESLLQIATIQSGVSK